MIVETRKTPNTKSKTWSLLATSCWHLGISSIHEDGIHVFLERAKKEPWVHLGDIIEAIMCTDKRFHAETHSKTVMAQLDAAEGLLAGAADTCWGLLSGNHEDAVSRLVGNVSRRLAQHSGIPFLGSNAYLKVNGTTTLFVTHPYRSLGASAGAIDPERRQAGQKVALRNMLKHFVADAHIMGHLHKVIVTEPVLENRLVLDDKLVLKRRAVPISMDSSWYVSVPSMFKNYQVGTAEEESSYAEKKLYPSTSLGWMRLIGETKSGTIVAVQYFDEDGNQQDEYVPQVR